MRSLKDNKNELEIWNLAGDGWREILKQHKSDVIKKYVKSLSTPRTSNVNELFESILGVKDISKNWYWKGMSAKQANKKLEGLITLRGEIAHTVKTAASIKEYDYFLCRLAVISHNRCTDHLGEICGKAPWIKYKFGHTT